MEAWEYQKGAQLDVPNSLVYSKAEEVITTISHTKVDECATDALGQNKKSNVAISKCTFHCILFLVTAALDVTSIFHITVAFDADVPFNAAAAFAANRVAIGGALRALLAAFC